MTITRADICLARGTPCTLPRLFSMEEALTAALQMVQEDHRTNPSLHLSAYVASGPTPPLKGGYTRWFWDISGRMARLYWVWDNTAQGYEPNPEALIRRAGTTAGWRLEARPMVGRINPGAVVQTHTA